MVTKFDDRVLTLTNRVRNGLEYCAELWEKAKQCDDPGEFKRKTDQLDNYVNRLQGMITTLLLMGYDRGCVFGDCKFSDNFVCFGCTKITTPATPIQKPMTMEGLERF